MQDLVAVKGSDENDLFGFSGSVKHRFSINNKFILMMIEVMVDI